MTLCIAAECRLGRERRVILASDYETENDIVGAEIQPKLMRIGHSHIALIAGTLSRAMELIVVCEEFFSTEHGLRLDTLDRLRECVVIQKKRLADEHIGGQLGISYEKFLTDGKTKLPDDLFRELSYDIKHITLSCSLLVVNFAEGQPRIFRIHDTGMIEMCNNFAAVGTGMYIAESMMFLREHHDNLPLREAMYNVYEAMRLGSRAPGVGDTFSIIVLSCDARGNLTMQQMTDEYEQYLDKQLDQFGPREVGKIHFRPEYLTTVKR